MIGAPFNLCSYNSTGIGFHHFTKHDSQEAAEVFAREFTTLARWDYILKVEVRNAGNQVVSTFEREVPK